jgi:hypothetical protein
VQRHPDGDAGREDDRCSEDGDEDANHEA